MTKKPHAYSIHAKISEENIHATWYLQEKPIVAADLDVLLRFSAIHFPSCSKTPSMPHSSKSAQKKNLSVQEYKSDKIERELQNWTYKSLWTDPQKHFY